MKAPLTAEMSLKSPQPAIDPSQGFTDQPGVAEEEVQMTKSIRDIFACSVLLLTSLPCQRDCGMQHAGSGSSSQLNRTPARRKSQPQSRVIFWLFGLLLYQGLSHSSAKTSSRAAKLYLGKPQPDPSLPTSCLLLSSWAAQPTGAARGGDQSRTDFAPQPHGKAYRCQ